jgi:hypothetical protein
LRKSNHLRIGATIKSVTVRDTVSTKAIVACRKRAPMRAPLPRGLRAAEEFTTMSLRTENRTSLVE